MIVAINCAFYQPRGGGIAEYTYNLVRNLDKLDNRNDYILYVLKDMEEYAKLNLPNRFKIKVIPYSSSYIDVVKRSLFSQKFWYKEELLEKFDIFHSPFFHSPRFKRARVLITVHDMRFYRFPYTYTWPRYIYLRHAVKRSSKAANHIITISHFTKDELVEAYGLADEKITVVHEAINKERFSSKLTDFILPPKYSNIEKCKYILSVGHLEPRKNYERLINAFSILKQQSEMKDMKLLIVGKKGHHFKGILKRISETNDVLYLDFVEHKTLQWLYKHAALFVFPSYYEGFGFPPLEAGCYGVVSAVSNVSSMPEICGEAVFYFDPYNVENMASVIFQALKNKELIDEKRTLMEAQINSFSWEKNVLQTIDLYNKIANM